MAQLETIEVKLLVDADISTVRRKVKQIRTLSDELNRDLAALQERLGTLGGELAKFGIGLEVGND